MRTRIVLPLVLLTGLFVAAGGFIHLREWLEVYRDVPARVPGSEVVTLGFPINAATSALVVIGLGVAYRRGGLRWVLGATLLFQLGSLAVLVLTRTGSVLGWREPVWNAAAEQSRAVELAAIAAAVAALAAVRLCRREPHP